MNRSLWIESLTENFCPPWPCPVCRKGTLALIPKSLVHKETIESKRAQDDEGWDPDWITHKFTAWAECRHPNCKQEFAIAGTGGVGPEIGENGSYEWQEYFSPMFCQPMPHMIEIPSKFPGEVRDELHEAFALFWSCRAACAGRIRVALESVMNYLGVPKRKKEKNGRYSDLTLHARIDAFAKTNSTVGSQLMALKWLGNAGSHSSEVSRDDLLDAFEVMEHSLGEIIDKRSEKVAALAKKLIKKHKR